METRRLVSLGEVAELINDEVKPSRPVRRETPFIWWDRTTKDRDIKMTMPMPEPDERVGVRSSPLWQSSRIIEWFREWKDDDTN